MQCTEVRFASFFSGGFTTMAVMNPPEKNLEKRTSVQWSKVHFIFNAQPEIQILNRFYIGFIFMVNTYVAVYVLHNMYYVEYECM